MAPGELFDADEDDTDAALMGATYRALAEHGYADLTIQAIGDEFGKSTSLLYHHYEGKDDLLVAFLHYVLDRFEADVDVGDDGEGPWETLIGLLDHVLAPAPDEGRQEFTTAMIDLRAQATHDPAYRRAFERHDEVFHDRLASVVARGVETGAFRAVDPERVAALVQTTFNGAMLERVTTDPDAGVPLSGVRTELEATLDDRLRGPDA